MKKNAKKKREPKSDAMSAALSAASGLAGVGAIDEKEMREHRRLSLGSRRAPARSAGK